MIFGEAVGCISPPDLQSKNSQIVVETTSADFQTVLPEVFQTILPDNFQAAVHGVPEKQAPGKGGTAQLGNSAKRSSGSTKAPPAQSPSRGPERHRAQPNTKTLQPKADNPMHSTASMAAPPSGLTAANLAARGSFASGAPQADSFATNIAAAGSFATRAPNSMSFQAGVMGRQSFGAQRSDASFAAGLPPSAAGSTPAGLNTQPPQGLTTRVPTSSSFASGVPGGLTTQPPPAGLSTQMPMCTSFVTGGAPSQGSFATQLPSTGSFVGAMHPHPSRKGPGMEAIRE